MHEVRHNALHEPIGPPAPVEEEAFLRRILVVEDDSRIQLTLRRSLGFSGWSVSGAPSAEEARRLLENESFALILLDWMLPGQSGVDLCRWLRTEAAFPEAGVIMLTGMDAASHLAEALEAGADDYIAKPFDQEDLETRLQILSRRVRDRLARRKAEAEHAASDKRYRELVESIPDVVYQLTPEGDFVYVSPAIRQFGYEPEDLTGKHFSELLHPTDIPRVSRHMRLPDLAGIHTGADHAPKLFDERRGGERMTRDLEVRLRTAGGEERDVSLGFVGEVMATGIYGLRPGAPEREFLGTVGTIHDITERRRSQSALRASEETWRAVMRASLHAVDVVDREGHLLASNAIPAAPGGWTAEAVEEGEGDYFERLPPDLARSRCRYFERVLHERHAVHFQDGADGRYYETTIYPVLDEDEAVGRVVILSRDVTAAIEAQAALRENERWLRGLLEAAEAMIWRVDPEGKIVFINPAVKQILGYEPEEAIGRALVDFASPDEARHDAAFLKRFHLFHEETARRESAMRTASGEVRWVLHAVSATRDAEGRVVALQGTTVDLTERRRAERNLSLQNEILKTLNRSGTPRQAVDRILEQLRHQIDTEAVAIRIEQNGKLPILSQVGFSEDVLERVNTTCLEPELPGSSAAKKRGAPGCLCSGLLDPDCRSEHLHRSRGGSAWTGDIKALRDDLFRRWPGETIRSACADVGFHSLAFIPIETEKEGAVGVLQLADRRHDRFGEEIVRFFEHIADCIGLALQRVTSEQALLRSQQLSAVGELAGGVAHEFNNILAPVVGYLGMLVDSPNLTEKEGRWIRTAFKAASQAASVTRNLLNFSGIRKENRHLTSLETVVRDTLGLVQNEFESMGIRIRFEAKKAPPVYLDPSEIAQVVMNLLINARHALIDRERKEIRIEVGKRGTDCFVRIADTGCGIAPGHLSKLFLPFFTTKGEHAPAGSPYQHVKGTGLGLAVSDSVVRSHDGRITVESEPEKGTVFTIWLPYVHAQEEPHPAAPRERAGRLAGARVVVVDDEALIRGLVADILEAEGCEVTLCSDGHEALERLAAEETDILLMDLQMPRMNGMELLRRVRETEWGKRLRIVVLTGRLLDARGNRPDVGEDVPLLEKPFDKARLLDTLEASLHAPASRPEGEGRT